MRARLNDLTIRSLTTTLPQLDVWCTTLPGFGIRVSRRGTKTFILKASNKRYSLGRYPYVSLKDARDEAKRRIGLKYLPPSARPAKSLIEQYLQARKASLRVSSLEQMRFRLRYFPEISINQATRPVLAQAIAGLAPVHQNIVFGNFKTFLNWCVDNEYLSDNPLRNRRAPNRRTSRDRLLSDEEIRSIWLESHNHGVFGSIIRTLVLSGQRRGQIFNFSPDWVRNNAIHFPPEVMKTGSGMELPLTGRLRENLPVLTKRFNSQAASMLALRAALPDIPHWTLHDFRRYFSSTMAKIGTPIDITEALLAHTTGSRNPIQRTYDRYNRLEPMRTALENYERYFFTSVLGEQMLGVALCTIANHEEANRPRQV